MAASIISLIVIEPRWNTVPPGAKVGAALDVLVLIVMQLLLKDKILDLVHGKKPGYPTACFGDELQAGVWGRQPPLWIFPWKTPRSFGVLH